MGSGFSVERRRLWPRTRLAHHFDCPDPVPGSSPRADRPSTQRAGSFAQLIEPVLGMSSRSSLKQWLAPFRIALVIAFVIAFVLGLAAPRLFASGKLSLDERIELERGLSSEIANAKMQLPRSKKALTFSSDGRIDDAAWQKAQREFGIAARVGDQIQITRVVIEADKILLEINGGLKGGHRWYDHIQVSAPIGASYPTDQNDNSNAAS